MECMWPLCIEEEPCSLVRVVGNRDIEPRLSRSRGEQGANDERVCGEVALELAAAKRGPWLRSERGITQL